MDGGRKLLGLRITVEISEYVLTQDINQQTLIMELNSLFVMLSVKGPIFLKRKPFFFSMEEAILREGSSWP